MSKNTIKECTRDDIPDHSRITCLVFWDKMGIIFKGLEKEEAAKLMTEIDLVSFVDGSYSGKYIVKGEGKSVAALAVKIKGMKNHNDNEEWKILKRKLGLMRSLRTVILSAAALMVRVPKNTLHIDSICVDDGFRNMGIGNHILSFVENLAVEKGMRYLTLEVIGTNLNAKRLYERVGFKVEKYKKSWLTGRIFEFSDTYLMKKDLNP